MNRPRKTTYKITYINRYNYESFVLIDNISEEAAKEEFYKHNPDLKITKVMSFERRLKIGK